MSSDPSGDQRAWARSKSQDAVVRTPRSNAHAEGDERRAQRVGNRSETGKSNEEGVKCRRRQWQRRWRPHRRPRCPETRHDHDREMPLDYNANARRLRGFFCVAPMMKNLIILFAMTATLLVTKDPSFSVPFVLLYLGNLRLVRWAVSMLSTAEERRGFEPEREPLTAVLTKLISTMRGTSPRVQSRQRLGPRKRSTKASTAPDLASKAPEVVADAAVTAAASGAWSGAHEN